MDSNTLWQYAVVLLIVSAALVKIIMGLRRVHSSSGKRKNPSCFGCSLSDSCNKNVGKERKDSISSDADSHDADGDCRNNKN